MIYSISREKLMVTGYQPSIKYCGSYGVTPHIFTPLTGLADVVGVNLNLVLLDLFVMEPYGPPGYAQHYSSTNYLLLTAIIEKIAGASVPDEVERVFLEPLELDNTFKYGRTTTIILHCGASIGGYRLRWRS